MSIVDDVLTLENVCKNCDDGTSDLQVIQCNASNVHGYQFIDAFVNVLRESLALCHLCTFYHVIIYGVKL